MKASVQLVVQSRLVGSVIDARLRDVTVNGPGVRTKLRKEMGCADLHKKSTNVGTSVGYQATCERLHPISFVQCAQKLTGRD